MSYDIIRELNLSNITETADGMELEEEQVRNFVRVLLSVGVIETKRESREVHTLVPMEIQPSYVDLKSPIRVTWLVTNKCNLSCKHCYVRARPSVRSTELPFVDIKNILRKLADAGVFTMYFTGGEPFVRHDFMDILMETSDLGLKIGISTNGLFIDKEVVRKLVKFNVFRAQVSLDGATKKTHEFIRGAKTFERTVSAIKKLVKGGIDVGITFVCHKENLHELEELILLAARLQVRGVKVSPLMAWGRAKEELNEHIPAFKFRASLKEAVVSACKRTGVNLLNELHIDVGMPEEHPYGCPLVMGMTLLPDVKVIPCEVFGESLSQNVILGDLKNQTVEEIWHSPRAELFRRAAGVANKPNCNKCPHLRTCGSYCLAEVFLEYKRLTPPREYLRECKSIWAHSLSSLSAG